MIFLEPFWFMGMEESGRVREAYRSRGIPAVSCDYLPSALEGPHLQGDVFHYLKMWEHFMLGGIFFPTCTYLCSSGLHWNKRVPGRQALTDAAVEDVKRIWNSKIPKLAIENPIGCLSTRFMPPTQIIQPWQFGHPESKATCLWLRGLPPLKPTKILSLPACGHWENQTPSGQNKLGPSPDRAKMRSRTYPGIAAAMAEQWGVPSVIGGLL